MKSPQLSLDGFQHCADPGKMAPLVHKWFARRRPEAIRTILSGLSQCQTDRKLRILDPFMGSGMMLLEALADGHDVFGVDINPVAWLIARQTLTPPLISTVEQAFHEVDAKVGQRIRDLYRTMTPGGTCAETVTAFYVRVVRDPDENEVELHHNYLIARNKKLDWAVYYCPCCGSIFPYSCAETVVCKECQEKFSWQTGNVSGGFVRIGALGKSSRLRDLYGQESHPPRFKLVAVESYSEETGRLYHKPSELDFSNVRKAEQECLQNDVAKNLLAAQIPAHRRDARPISHGFRYYGELYTPRQLLSLSLIAEVVRGLEDGEARYSMALALSDAAGSNNLMCRYAADWLKLTPAFGLHGFDVVTRPVEGNVWGADRGRGSFKNCVSKAGRAYSAIGSALKMQSTSGSGGPIREVRCEAAQVLGELPWEPMDVVMTDPPYYDNLDYGELSDFYYQWLRIALREIPPFHRTNSLDQLDLASIAGIDGDPDRFAAELGIALTQSLKILKPSGVVAFSYHHTKPQAWLSLTKALVASNLVPYKLRFVRSELENGFHSSEGNIKIDSIYYCRRGKASDSYDPNEFVLHAKADLAKLDRLRSVDLDSAVFAIAAALKAIDPSRDFSECVKLSASLLDDTQDVVASK